MGQVNAMSSTVVTAAPDKVLAALSDYETVRPRILSEQYLDYKVVEGKELREVAGSCEGLQLLTFER